ncbi:hypothetical protein LTR04_000579 [Oleoguttula sp. CCFEE 6159]|nr:hypothetical protein LTR04_000579 [Oleoguttula sp. CCFEE 6159]
MKLLYYCLAFALPALSASTDDDSKKAKTAHKPCTIKSPTSGAFFDLTPISVVLPEEGRKAHKDDRTESWHARGYDYPANFTINFCAPVVEDVKDVVGVDERLWRNVSAFYKMGGRTYSIGQQNSEPVFRGRKLILNYTDGSPCTSTSSHFTYSQRSTRPSLQPREIIGGDRGDKHRGHDDDDDDDDEKKQKGQPGKNADVRRKSTIISLLCERDPLSPLATVAFVASSPDECTYFFEARTSAACGGIEAARQQLGPGGVFGVIFLIFVLVYIVGGCVYQRTVMHQRGWRQLPNYSMWAGIGGFVKDIFIILTSSCTRLLPSRRGYARLSPNGSGGGFGQTNAPPHRGRQGSQDSESENRLIDQLDEEWDD